VWQWARAANHLVAFAWVNTHLEGKSDSLVKFRPWKFPNEVGSFFQGEHLAVRDHLGGLLVTFASCLHGFCSVGEF
jgi:hypothetical protein